MCHRKSYTIVRSECKMSETEGKFNIVPMAPDDKPIIVGFIKEFFFRREPLVVSSKISEDAESMEKLETFGLRALDTGIVFKAVSDNGDLMGVILNEIITRDGTEHNNDDDNHQHQEDSVSFKKFRNLFQKAKRESDIFGKYPEVERIMHIKIVAVDDAFKGRGVCTALFDKTKELALENQCPMVHVECSSHFSAAAAKKLGYQCIYFLRYKEFKDEDGQAMFTPPPPHEQFKVLVLPV